MFAAPTTARSTLALEGEGIADVHLPPMPEYYRHRLENGKSVMEIAPTIQWGYLIYLTVLRLCQYFGAKEECQFCDINHNWRQHKQAGRPYTGCEAGGRGAGGAGDHRPVRHHRQLARLHPHRRQRHLHRGRARARPSSTAATRSAIEERFPGRWIGKVVAQALPKEEAQIFQDYGIRIYHPNYEVWDERIFKLVSPGSSGTWDARSGTAASSTRATSSAPAT